MLSNSEYNDWIIEELKKIRDCYAGDGNPLTLKGQIIELINKLELV